MNDMELASTLLGPRTKVRIVMDSGDIHTGYLTEADLKEIRDAMEGTGGKTVSITLYTSATDDTNNHLQMVSAKIESLKLL